MADDIASNADGRVSVRRHAVTVHDVARVAGVSSMTVSRVVNGTKVRPPLKDKVEAAIEQLGYVPNLAARAARAGSIRIGVLFSNPRSSNLGDFLMGAFDRAGIDGSQLVVEPVAAHPSGVDAVRKVIRMGVDGIVLPPPLCDSLEILDLLWQSGICALSFATADPRSHSPSVRIDDFEGARTMTRHLISLGHRDIGYIRGDPRHSPALRREEGFRAEMASAGIAVNPKNVVDGDFSYRSGFEAAARLLDQKDGRPTAIFASNDDMAAGVAAMALGRGVRIPAELSVAGFDDTPIASLMWPQLTTIRQPLKEMAGKAVELVGEAIRANRAGGVESVAHEVLPFSLQTRESTGPVAGQTSLELKDIA